MIGRGYSFYKGNEKHNYKDEKLINKNDYLSRSYNTLIVMLAKDKEYVYETWQADLNRVNSKLESFYNKLFQSGGIPIYNGRGELESLRFKDTYYMNFNNPEALDFALQANGIDTIEKMELNPVQWDNLSSAINTFDDFLVHGYDEKIQRLQYNYPEYVFNNLMYLRTADFNKDRDTKILKELIKSCDDIGLSSQIYERLAINDNLFNVLKKDYDYELIDEYDIYAMCKNKFNKDSVNTDILPEYTNIYFKGENKRVIDTLKNAGQLYIDTSKGIFYFPIIECDTLEGRTYFTFDEAAEIINNMEIQCDYMVGNDEFSDSFKINSLMDNEKISFNSLCPRIGYELPQEFSKGQNKVLETEAEYEL